MKWVHDRDSDGIYISCLNMSVKEFNMILPIVKKELEKVTKQRDKFRDILDGGEATEKQCNMLIRFDSMVENLANFCSQQIN
jgi:hypothetical protein